jgi:hypothetical protein
LVQNKLNGKILYLYRFIFTINIVTSVGSANGSGFKEERKQFITIFLLLNIKRLLWSVDNVAGSSRGPVLYRLSVVKQRKTPRIPCVFEKTQSVTTNL